MTAPALHLAPTGNGSAKPAAAGAVLLLHGLCANPMELQPLARALRRAGATVEVPLLHGCGIANGQPDSARVQPWEAWLDQAHQAYLQLVREHGRVAIGGLCMGAVLSLALAQRVDAAALLLVSPTLYFDGWNVSPWRRLLPIAYLPGLRQRMSFAESAPYGLKNDRLRLWVEAAMQEGGVSAAGAARLPATHLHQATRLMRHVRRNLGDIQVPTLVLHAAQDDVAGPRTVHKLLRDLGRAPDVRWFHDSYHMLTLDNEREAVCAEATRFITPHLLSAAPAAPHSPLATATPASVARA